MLVVVQGSRDAVADLEGGASAPALLRGGKLSRTEQSAWVIEGLLLGDTMQ